MKKPKATWTAKCGIFTGRDPWARRLCASLVRQRSAAIALHFKTMEMPVPLRTNPVSAVPSRTALLAIAAFGRIEALAERLHVGPVDRPSLWGLQWALARTALDCGALLLGLLVIGKVDRLPHAIFRAFGLGCQIGPLSWLYYLRVVEAADISLPCRVVHRQPAQPGPADHCGGAVGSQFVRLCGRARLDGV